MTDTKAMTDNLPDGVTPELLAEAREAWKQYEASMKSAEAPASYELPDTPSVRGEAAPEYPLENLISIFFPLARGAKAIKSISALAKGYEPGASFGSSVLSSAAEGGLASATDVIARGSAGALSPEEAAINLAAGPVLAPVASALFATPNAIAKFGRGIAQDVRDVSKRAGSIAEKLGFPVGRSGKSPIIEERVREAAEEVAQTGAFAGGSSYDAVANKVVGSAPINTIDDLQNNFRSIVDDITTKMDDFTSEITKLRNKLPERQTGAELTNKEIENIVAGFKNRNTPFNPDVLDTTEKRLLEIQDFISKEGSDPAILAQVVADGKLGGAAKKITAAIKSKMDSNGSMSPEDIISYLRDMNRVERAAQKFDAAVEAKLISGDVSAISKAYDQELAIIDKLRPIFKQKLSGLVKQTTNAAKDAGIAFNEEFLTPEVYEQLLKAYGSFTEIERALYWTRASLPPMFGQESIPQRSLNFNAKELLKEGWQKGKEAVFRPEHIFRNAERSLISKLKELQGVALNPPGDVAPGMAGKFFKALDMATPPALMYSGLRALSPYDAKADMLGGPEAALVNRPPENDAPTLIPAAAIPQPPAGSILGGAELPPSPGMGQAGLSLPGATSGLELPPGTPMPGEMAPEEGGTPIPPPLPRDVQKFFATPPEAMPREILSDPESNQLLQEAAKSQDPAVKEAAVAKILAAHREVFEPPAKGQELGAAYDVVWSGEMPKMLDPLKRESYRQNVEERQKLRRLSFRDATKILNALNSSNIVLELTEGWQKEAKPTPEPEPQVRQGGQAEGTVPRYAF